MAVRLEYAVLRGVPRMCDDLSIRTFIVHVLKSTILVRGRAYSPVDNIQQQQYEYLPLFLDTENDLNGIEIITIPPHQPEQHQ